MSSLLDMLVHNEFPPPPKKKNRQSTYCLVCVGVGLLKKEDKEEKLRENSLKSTQKPQDWPDTCGSNESG